MFYFSQQKIFVIVLILLALTALVGGAVVQLRY